MWSFRKLWLPRLPRRPKLGGSGYTLQLMKKALEYNDEFKKGKERNVHTYVHLHMCIISVSVRCISTFDLLTVTTYVLWTRVGRYLNIILHFRTNKSQLSRILFEKKSLKSDLSFKEIFLTEKESFSASDSLKVLAG
jgi:hypothetical protein